MYGQDILHGISKGAFEIQDKQGISGCKSLAVKSELRFCGVWPKLIRPGEAHNELPNRFELNPISGL